MTKWAQALDAYITHLGAAGKAPTTVRLKRYQLLHFAKTNPSPFMVARADIERALAEPRWSPETRKSYRSALCGFYRWALNAGLIEDDPTRDLATIHVPRGVARPCPEALVAELIAHGDARIALMAMLGAYCGLRAAEIARLNSRDLVGDELTVFGKGGKTRTVPVASPVLMRRLRSVDGWAFPNGLGGHLTPGHVTKLLSRALPDGWTAHTLRHRMASVSYAATRDLLAVGAVLGHSRPETTQRYVKLPNDALRAAVASASAA